jgi:hypothetical protein
MRYFKRNGRGQILVMATLALFAMCGMLGLAIDLGWSYFVKKSAQAAADSAALAAALAAFEVVGQNSPYTCGVGLTCQATPAPCLSPPPNPPSNNLDNGCLYAQSNGFTVGGNGGRQNVLIAADTTSPPPTAPGVWVYYWVTARTSESIPQLFSSIFGNTVGVSSARGTAGIADSVLAGSMWMLNRQNDPGTWRGGEGSDLYIQGDSWLTTGGIFMASTGNAATLNYAGHAGGNAQVTAPAISIRGDGAVDNPDNFVDTSGQAVVQNGFADLPMMFEDPMRDLGQPLPPTGLPPVEVPGGTLLGDCDNPAVVQPGAYYATKTTGQDVQATGQPITISGCVTFSSGSSGFGGYVFYGGLSISGPGTVATFEPGRYVLAGSTTGYILSQRNGTIVQDNTPLLGGASQPNTDAGEIFIFTDAKYPGLDVPPDPVKSILSNLKFGDIDIQSGNQIEMNLHGLNKNATTGALLPGDLTKFAPTVFWQDQRNSTILYTADGNIDVSCGTLDSPCMNDDQTISPNMHIQAHPNLFLYGLFYQPRGASLTFQGHGDIQTPLQLITGALSLQGGPNITLQPISNPFTRRVVALIE